MKKSDERSQFNVCPSLPSVATDSREWFQRRHVPYISPAFLSFFPRNQLIMQALVLLLVVMVTISASHDYVRVCYYTNWSQYRTPPANFTPSAVNPYLCTHLVFAFAVIDDQNKVNRFFFLSLSIQGLSLNYLFLK